MQRKTNKITAIVPTIGRPDSLRRLLKSLAAQTCAPDEVIVADGSEETATKQVVVDPLWRRAGLVVTHIGVFPPNAVGQREAAIVKASGNMLLLLDDDVELDRNCVAEMLRVFELRPNAVGVMADFSNQPWPMPTRAWRIYLRWVLGLDDGAWQGRVVGPLLRFGFSPAPNDIATIDWLGTCNSMIRREAYEKVGGFSDFFLHRCTMNEDVDLGLKLRRVGSIYFAPKARLAHYHDPGGRVSPTAAAEDDIFNRYMILRHTLDSPRGSALAQIFLFAVLETVSGFLGGIRRGRAVYAFSLGKGRLDGLLRVITARE